jgi:hypothetical protein
MPAEPVIGLEQGHLRGPLEYMRRAEPGHARTDHRNTPSTHRRHLIHATYSRSPADPMDKLRRFLSRLLLHFRLSATSPAPDGIS